MRKILAITLMFFTILTASAQNATASVLKQSHVLITLSADTARHQSDAVDVSLSVANQSIDSVAEATVDGGQTTSSTPQTLPVPKHHNHHVRNLVIFGVVLAIGLVCLAAAAK
jgi:hypothetical protein